MSHELAGALERFRAAPRRTAYEAIVTTLREAILTGALPPGTRLVQTDVATQFGVSNTPVREALRQLAAEQLVQFDAFRGAVVRQPTLDEIREGYELATVLAPLAARRAATRMSDEQRARLHEIDARMRGQTDVRAWTQLNHEFHDLIEEAAASPRLTAILSGLRDARMLQVILGGDARLRTIGESNREHGELLAAFDAGDAGRAAAVMERHVGASLAAVERALASRTDDAS